MSTKILISDPIAEEGIDKLKEQGFELDIKVDLSPEELEEQISSYHGMVVRSATKVREPIIDAAENLKIIVRAGVGLDNIDVNYAENKGIKVQNTPEASSNSVAELAIGHMLSLARGIPRGTSSLKEGEWIKSELRGSELAGKKLGIIGIGRIGSLLAKKGEALGMEPRAYDKFIEEAPVEEVEMMDKKDVISTADFLSLHIPFIKSEGPTISTEELKSMKESAYLINCARGGVVDEKALKEALEKGWIAGAALDVYESERPGKNDLCGNDNVSLTPHIGASTVEAQRRVGEGAAEKLIEFFS